LGLERPNTPSEWKIGRFRRRLNLASRAPSGAEAAGAGAGPAGKPEREARQTVTGRARGRQT